MNKVGEQVVDVNDVCRITENTIIKGEISSRSDIRVDGTINGKLYSDSRIVVGEKAKIVGTIVCTNLDFWGNLKGDVFVKDVLSLKSSSCIEGNINVRKLNVELGAQVIGNCKMISEDQFETSKKTLITTKVNGKGENGAADTNEAPQPEVKVK